MQQQEATSLVRFKVVHAAGVPYSSSLLGSRVRIVSYPRALVPTCPTVLALHAQWTFPRPAARTAGRNPPCGRMTPQLGSLVSLGAQQWVLEDARPPGSAIPDLLVRIRTAVRLAQGLLGFRFQNGCWLAVTVDAESHTMSCLQQSAAATRLTAAHAVALALLPQVQPQCFWYLGAPASCAAGASVQLYPGSSTAAATVWRLTRVG